MSALRRDEFSKGVSKYLNYSGKPHDVYILVGF